MDLKPDLSSVELYRAKIEKDLKQTNESKIEAFNWAVDGLNFEYLQKNYQDKSYRQIAESEMDKKLISAEKELAEIQSSINKVLDELKKIKTETKNPRIKNDFFGSQFNFDLTVANQSSFDFSRLVWNVKLYLDGSDTPSAEDTIYSFYESKGGLKSGHSVTETIKVGTFRPSEGWVTLASKNAKERKVAIELGNAYDFANKSYLDSRSLELRDKYSEMPSTVEKFKMEFEKKDEQAQSTKTASTTRQVNRTSCTNNCVNGSCVRTFPDGSQENWQAQRKLDPFTQNWGWDTTTNACGIN